MTGTGIPAGAFVGQVTDTPTTRDRADQSGGSSTPGSFTLVDSVGHAARRRPAR